MPSTTMFSPKQVARALGVSESSVKRWVDSGKLQAAKTAGGHRKVTLPSIATFVRETGHPMAQPELLGMVAAGAALRLDDALDLLFESLINGREAECRELILSFYQQGETIPRLGDLLIGPTFRRIGVGWAEGAVTVHQERRSCEVTMAVLHEIRRWLPEVDGHAPLALIAAPLQDFAEVPARLVELTLTSNGWQTIQAGSGLPLEEIRDSAAAKKPALLCVSATHLQDPAGFLRDYADQVVTPLRESSPATQHVLGGGAVEAPELVEQCAADRFTKTLGELVEYLEELKLVA